MRHCRAFGGLLMAGALGLALASSGCVLVVGDGSARRGEVEWSGSDDLGASAAVSRVDGELAREVQARIRTDTALSREDITVASAGNVVTLHGRISSLVLLEHVMRVASEVPGVARVVSRLTVEMEAG
jgi:hypothetical protein